jgi:hypothetical protein
MCEHRCVDAHDKAAVGRDECVKLVSNFRLCFLVNREISVLRALEEHREMAYNAETARDERFLSVCIATLTAITREG